MNLGEYHDLYLKTDVSLLAYAFENFRRMCLDYYKLNAAHYFSAPGLSWDAALKKIRNYIRIIHRSRYVFICGERY